MRVAIAHDYLNQFGGAERVLQTLLEIFPDADCYTLLYDKEKTRGIFEGHKPHTSILDVPGIRKHHRLFIPLMPIAASLLKSKKEYDLLISSTAGYAKGFGIRASYHVSYCHSPLRYAWEIDYLKNLRFSPKALSNLVAYPIARWLRKWDRRAAHKVNLFMANSGFIAEKITSYYGRDAIVVYPPVDTELFHPELQSGKKDYYLMVGRLLYYKGFDLGIAAFNQLQKPLKIVGRGPELPKLKKLVKSPLIEFIESAGDDELRMLYSNAKALIFPQIEDFGLVAAEAQACGTPVIAFAKGGAREIVIDKKTGVLFHEQTPEKIIEAVQGFEYLAFDRRAIARSALRFSKEMFRTNILNTLAKYGFTF